MSLAISGDRNAALQTLAPLAARGDSGVPRVRAFVFALTGDSNAAMSAINAGDAGQLGAGRAVRPAAAFAFGRATGGRGQPRHLPGMGRRPMLRPPSSRAATDRLADLEALLRAGPPQPAAQAPMKPVQLAYAATTGCVQRPELPAEDLAADRQRGR